MPEVDTPNNGEREFETGSDEFAKAQSELNQAASAGQDRLTFLNAKRTYDVYQDLDLQTARQAAIEQSRLNQIAAQALQNAVETANMVGKQAVKHADVAADAMWNPVQQGASDMMTGTAGAIGATPPLRAITIDDASLKAIGAVVAAAVADALKVK